MTVVWWNTPPLPYDRPFEIIDSVLKTVGPEKRMVWLDCRDKALDSWEMKYDIIEMDGLPPLSTNHGEEVAVKGKIRLGRPETLESYGGWYGTTQGGIVAVGLYKGWFKDHNQPTVRGIVAHELGHCFGLGHSDKGVMSGANKPNDEEIAAVKGAY